MRAPWVRGSERDFTWGRQLAWPTLNLHSAVFFHHTCIVAFLRKHQDPLVCDDDELHILVVVFSTWRQMADRLPREGRKKHHKTRPRRSIWQALASTQKTKKIRWCVLCMAAIMVVEPNRASTRGPLCMGVCTFVWCVCMGDSFNLCLQVWGKY